MALRYLTGDPSRWNLFARGTRTSTNEDVKFPLSNVGNGDPAKPFKFNDAGSTRSVTVDVRLLTNGLLDSWSGGAPVGWTRTATGTGAVAEETVTVVTGSAARCNQGAGVGVAKIAQSFRVRTGERLQLEARLANNLGGTAKIYIQNLRTQKWLHATDGWTGGQVAYITYTGVGAYQLVGGGAGSPDGIFQVESFEDAGDVDTCLLEITCASEANANSFFENVFIYPAVNFGSIHGHNLEPGTPLVLKYSFDGSAFFNAVIMTPRPPAFYGLCDVIYAPHWRLEYTGTPSSANGAVWYGEAVVGYLETNLRAQMYGWETRHIFDQLRNQTPVGYVQAYRQAELERRALKLAFDPKTATDFEELRDQWARRSFGGFYPMIVIPDDSDSALVLHGRVLDEFAALREFSLYPTDLVIEESAFPTVTT